MKVLREIYDFITGGSIASPVLLACAIAAAYLLPSFRAEAFTVLVVLAFIVSTFERVT